MPSQTLMDRAFLAKSQDRKDQKTINHSMALVFDKSGKLKTSNPEK